MNIASIRGEVGLDDSDLQQSARRAKQTFDELASNAEKAGRRMADAIKDDPFGKLKDFGGRASLYVTAPLAAAGLASVKMASDLNESVSKLDAVFGKSSGALKAWAEGAVDNLGTTKQEAIEATATLGNLFTAMGIGVGQSADMSKSLVQLATDLGSFNNVPADQALIALRAGLVGETEPLRRFGVNLNEATLKAQALKMHLDGASEQTLPANTKALAAYALIMEQTKTAQGDFARTSGEMAGGAKKFVAELKEFGTELGTEVLPLAKDLVHDGREVVKFFRELSPEAKKTILILGGTAALSGPVLGFIGSLGTAINVVRGFFANETKEAVANTLALKANAAAAKEAAVAQGGIPSRNLSLNPSGFPGAAPGGMRLPFDKSGVVAGGLGIVGAVGLAAIGTELYFKEGADRAAEEARQSQAAAAQQAKDNPFGAKLAELRRKIEAVKARPGGANSRLAAELQAQYDATLRAGQADAARRSATGPATPPANPLDKSKISDDRFDALLAQGKARAAAAPESQHDQAEAAALLPVLAQQQADLRKRIAALATAAKTDEKAAKEYYGLQKDLADSERQTAELKERAAKERTENQKKATDAAKRQAEQDRSAREAYFGALVDRAKANNDGAEGNEARAEAHAVIPILEAKERSLADEAKALLPKLKSSAEAREEYFKLQQEYWQTEDQIQQLIKRGDDEARREQDKATREAEKLRKQQEEDRKKAIETARKTADEAQKVGDLQVQLLEARLKNDPFLNPQAKQKALRPLLEQQFRLLNRSVFGESESERLQRQLKAEAVKGEILKGFGAGKSARTLDGSLPLGDLRGARNELDRLSRIQREELGRPIGVPPKVATAPGVRQVVINFGPRMSDAEITRVVQNELKRETDGAAGGVY